MDDSSPETLLPDVTTKNEDKEEELGSLAFVAALVYGVGLSMNNMYLNEYGISDFSAIKPKAIFTGAIVLGSIALVAASPLLALSHLIDEKSQNSNNFAFRNIPILEGLRNRFPTQLGSAVMLLRVFLPLIVLIPLYLFLYRNTHGHLSSMPVVNVVFEGAQIVWLWLFGCGASIAFIQCVRKLRRVNGVKSFAGLASSFSAISVYLFLSILCLAVFMFVFNNTFYPFVPSVIGGSGFGFSNFAIREQDASELETLGVTFANIERHITSSMRVVYESDESVYVLIPQDGWYSSEGSKAPARHESFNRVVKIDKKEILGSFESDPNNIFSGVVDWKDDWPDDAPKVDDAPKKDAVKP